MTDKIDLKMNAKRRDNKGYIFILKGLIQEKEKDITLVNIYATNTRTSKYIN